MKSIRLAGYLLYIKYDECPLPEEGKVGKEISWGDRSKIRCSGCIYFKKLDLDNGRPAFVNCKYGEDDEKNSNNNSEL